MGGAKQELIWAKPFADALVSDPQFRSWLLRKTKFASSADGVHILHREMMAMRTEGTKYWWRHHFTEACRCSGCGGQETDVLAIFEDEDSTRFALHVEVKHPRDKFKKPTQARAYPERARCWARLAPATVLPHADATTMLLCSEGKLEEFVPYLPHFACVVTFEEIAQAFPHATALSGTR